MLRHRRSSSSGDSTTRMTTTTTTTTAAVPAPTPPASHSVPAPLQKRNSASLIGGGGGRGGRAAPALKYLWIRLALFERILAGIIEHLVDNHKCVSICDVAKSNADPLNGFTGFHWLSMDVTGFYWV